MQNSGLIRPSDALLPTVKGVILGNYSFHVDGKEWKVGLANIPNPNK
ncbi:hypothetical protein [Paenibacillus sp. L3-i20]|nr:hypothetical protein [Paenibacillus sp. L3-i20]